MKKTKEGKSRERETGTNMVLQQVSGRSAKRWMYPGLQYPGLGTVLNTDSYSSFMEVVRKED